MAFPSVEASAAYNAGIAAATTHQVPLPATVTPGSLLMIVGRAAVAGTISIAAGGWTIVQDSSDASDDVTFWAYMNTLAVGNEDGTNIGVTHGSGKVSAISLSITGAVAPATQPPQSSTVAIGTGSNPNPTTATPTGGAKDYLWIVFHGADGEHTISTYPYPSNNVTANTGTGGVAATNSRVAICTNAANAASLDAGQFALSLAANSGWTAWTIAVHPTTAVTYFGASTLTEAVTVTTAGTAETPANEVFGATSLTLTAARATAGGATIKGAASVTQTVARTTAAKLTAMATTATTETVGVTTAATRTRLATSSLAETVGVSTVGRVTAKSSVSRPEVVTVTTTPEVVGDKFGATALTETVAVASSGYVTATGTVALPAVVTATTTAHATAYGSATLPISVAINAGESVDLTDVETGYIAFSPHGQLLGPTTGRVVR